MEKIIYVVNSTELKLGERVVTSYGISCIQDGDLLVSLTDLSSDRDGVLRLIDRCNELQLDPDQLMDVAEDFII